MQSRYFPVGVFHLVKKSTTLKSRFIPEKHFLAEAFFFPTHFQPAQLIIAVEIGCCLI